MGNCDIGVPDKNGILEDTFLVKDPIKPYHIIDNTLSYEEEKRRAKVMDQNTKMDGSLKLDDECLKYLIS